MANKNVSRWLVLGALCALVAPSLAEARSGGSFGGGFRRSSSSSFSRSFGSSSSSRSSSRSLFGSSSSPSRSSYSAPSYRYGSGTTILPVPIPIGGGYSYGYHRPYYYGSSGVGSFVGLLALLAVVVGVVVVLYVVYRIRRRVMMAQEEKRNQVDVVNVQLGVQHGARAVQERLKAMAESADTSTDEGLARIVREVALELRRCSERIEYGALGKEPGLRLLHAETRFGLLAGNARTKYDREVVRRDSSGTRKQQKEVKTDGLRDEDGDIAVHEFFVVTLILGLRGLTLPDNLMGHQELDSLLTTLSQASADHVVAVEVIWSPASLSDAMSRQEMELRYPELMTI
jgi:uncharacterized membrane protein